MASRKLESFLLEASAHLSDTIQSELLRRHKAASTTVAGLLVAPILFSIVAFVGKSFFRQQQNPPLDIALRITILVFGLGAVTLRRTKFAAMRLQDIAALDGPSGLLRALERTTIQVAFLGEAIAAIGFFATLMTGNDFYTYGAGLVSVAVLLYSYPTRTSWQRTLRLFSTQTDEIPPKTPSK